MTARSSHIAVVMTAFLAGLAIFLAVFLYAAGYFARGGSPAPSVIGGAFSLTDQNGKTVTDQELRGRPFLVFFGFTHCPDVCPTALFEVSEVLRALGKDADRTAALFITVDPERDTPAIMKDYLSSFDPHLLGLSGERPAIETAMKAYRVYAKKVPTENGDYTMDHTALVYLMDKQGRFVAPFSLKRPPADAAADLRKYM